MLSKNKNSFIWLTLIFLCSLHAVQAANKTSTKSPQDPIDIKAQYLLMDESKGISRYKGNVLFTKGTLVIKADTVTLYSDGETLKKAIITGSPADIQHQPDNEEKVHSQANRMEYIVATEELTLTGRAFVDQGDQHFSGEVIKYNTQQRTVTASGSQSNLATQAKNTDDQSLNNRPSGRVHVIIGPKKNDVNVDSENNEKIK